MNNEPVAWFEQDKNMKSVWYQADQDSPNAIPLYTHLAKTGHEPNWKEMYWEMHDLNHKHWYELQVAKAEIKLLKAKTLTDEEILELKDEYTKVPSKPWNGIPMAHFDVCGFARAILRKAQEK